MILGRDELLARLHRHLDAADHLEIAVAWATPSPALMAVLRFAEQSKRRPRIVVGISGTGTHPLALRKLAQVCDLKVTKGEKGIFHPKFYRFANGATATCWTGSANLSVRGFGLNDEAVFEYRDSDGKGEAWFRKLWDSLPEDTSAEIDAYVETWHPVVTSWEQPEQIVEAPAFHPFHLLADGKVRDWPSYVTALRACDAYWQAQDWNISVFGEARSFVHTILAGNAVARTRDWSTFTRSDVEILLGHADIEGETAYGLLGRMRGAGEAVSVFLNDTDDNLLKRRRIQDAVLPLETAANFPEEAGHALQAISSIKRFKHGVATRLITLIRPASGISVNSGSETGLAALSGLARTTLGTPRNYTRLLEWVTEQPWYDVPEPEDGEEKLIWSMRAALIDPFVYLYDGSVP